MEFNIRCPYDIYEEECAVETMDSGWKLKRDLLKPEDYEIVGYRNNTGRGTGILTIHGLGDYCGYKNSEFDKLYKEFLEEFDMDKRKELVVQMQQILIDDAVAIIDGYYSSSMIYSKNVGKAHISTADYYWITSDIIPAE